MPVATLSAEQGQATSYENGMPVFGQLALVDRNPRQSTAVVSAPDTKLLVLPLESWAACAMAVPDMCAAARSKLARCSGPDCNPLHSNLDPQTCSFDVIASRLGSKGRLRRAVRNELG